MKPVRVTSGNQRLAPLGTLLLFGGLVLMILCGIESAQGLPGMPRFWYSNRTIWWGTAFGSMVAGFLCLLPRDHQSQVNWRPSQPGIRFRHLVVYTRAGCHLCDDALALLAAYRRWLPEVTEVDIDRDGRMVEKYGSCVPVVVCDGKVRFRGRVEPALLERLIEGSPPQTGA